MKLLDLIRPHFGAISICGAFLGDARKEDVLGKFDKDGEVQMNANYYPYARLALEDAGFDKGFVRFEYDDRDLLSRIFLDIEFEDKSDILWANRILYDYLSQSEYFDDHSYDEQKWTFLNGINEISVDVFEHELTLELNLPSASGIEPDEQFEVGVLRTISSLIREESDGWDKYVSFSTMKKIMLTYRREDEEYPDLWLLLPEDEVKKSPYLFSMHLTTEILKMIMVQAGMEFEAEAWVETILENIVFDPVSREPMDCFIIEDGTRERPMTREELEDAFKDIEYWDNERTAPPGVWDETPIG